MRRVVICLIISLASLLFFACDLLNNNQINESFVGETKDWDIIFTVVSETKNKQIFVTEKMTATYKGTLDTLKAYQMLNISCKTPFTETWFSEPIDLEKTSTTTFSLEGTVAIKSATEPFDIMVVITLGDTVEEIHLVKANTD